MELARIKSGYAFTRNPIIVVSDDDEHQQLGIDTFLVSLAGRKIYEGRFSIPFSIDISEIADSFVEYAPPPAQAGAIIEHFDDYEAAELKFEYIDEHEALSHPLSVKVIPGGVSKQNYRRFLSFGSDAFAVRFLNRSGNYFLTTRTSDWRIVMKETELFPLYFLVDKPINEIVISATSIDGVEWVSNALEPGLYALDIDALRRYLFDTGDVLASEFDVVTDGVFSCRVVISRARLAKERYRLKFRNSLGVFEIIELAGSLSTSAAMDDTADKVYDRWDSTTRSFTAAKGRTEQKKSVTVDGLEMSLIGLPFFMDMIASDEVYLLDAAPTPLQVIPSVEDLSLRRIPTNVETVSLKLDICDSDISISEDVDGIDDSKKPRIFSKQFSSQFN